jgi:non-heme chloroperoxidase
MRRKALVVTALVVPSVAALALTGMIALGTAEAPPPLASVYDNVRRIDQTGLPPLERYAARDGEALAYRAYPGGGERVAVLVHGSTGMSNGMNAVAKALNADGATVYALDMRGHGASGRRGDVDYLGQLDDDLADFMAQIRPHHPAARFVLIGFSAGGGYALRIAGGRYGDLFDGYLLLAPYLGYRSPTSRSDGGGWAAPYVPRIIALSILERLGIHWFEGLPIVAFARRPDPTQPVPTYSFRLALNFAPHVDLAGDFRAARKPLAVLVGADDDEMVADAYAPLLQGLRPDAPVEVIAGVGHMGMTIDPPALAAIRATVERQLSAAPASS